MPSFIILVSCVANEPPSLDSPTPKAPPVTPVTPAVIPASSSGSSAASGGVVIDHYLCTCLERDSDDVECLQAVKAACVVGHIPAKDCAASFDNVSPFLVCCRAQMGRS